MDIEKLIALLEGKDTKEAFEALKELENISEDSNIIYCYIDKFYKMISDKKYVMRVRGFRLFCKQARWDTKNFIDKNINEALCILKDEKPTAVRQALAALQEVVIYKRYLSDVIKKRIIEIDCKNYRDTMSGLIEADIQTLLNMMRE